MIKLSSKVRYALLALLELASYYEQGNCLQIDQIVASQPIPEGYLVQVLIALRRCGLVSSQRGAKGGYSLNKAPSEITLFEIVACLEGKRQPWTRETFPHRENLLIEEIWQEAENSVITVFGSYTLKDMCDKREKCRQFDSMYYI
jgi:Rrf2 family transcriptional regulator, cysteine metabolism repressor